MLDQQLVPPSEFTNSSTSGNGSPGDGETAPDEPRAACTDLGFAIAFLVMVALVIAIALSMGVAALDDGTKTQGGAVLSGSTNPLLDHPLTTVFFTSSIVGGVISIFWVVALQRFSWHFIVTSLYGSVIVTGSCGVIAAVGGLPYTGMVVIIAAIVIAIYIYFTRSRVRLAAANFKLASRILNLYPSIFVVSIMVMLLMLLWSLVFAMAFAGARHRLLGTGASEGFTLFMLCLSLWWGIQTIKNVLVICTAKVVVKWWRSTAHPDRLFACGALKAVVPHLGSVALGSLLVTFFSVIRGTFALFRLCGMRTSAMQRAGPQLLPFLERFSSYCTTYALCEVALTGHSFLRSGKDATGENMTRGGGGGGGGGGTGSFRI